MTKLNIIKHFKVEKDGVYVIKLNHEPTLEVIQGLQQQFNGLSKEYGCKFVLLGNQMEILTNEELFSSEEFRNQLIKILSSNKVGPVLVKPN